MCIQSSIVSHLDLCHELWQSAMPSDWGDFSHRTTALLIMDSMRAHITFCENSHQFQLLSISGRLGWLVARSHVPKLSACEEQLFPKSAIGSWHGGAVTKKSTIIKDFRNAEQCKCGFVSWPKWQWKRLMWRSYSSAVQLQDCRGRLWWFSGAGGGQR